ncbi:copper radical oxidase [Myriangium duriaei CBS 260.36]|uniref:Copper radical oxidase n=1 Tax=Myriangium duriaei CBS 260.36 TaxID=1168546 RepID=A0A9P4IVC5_9PEZI|nr:copper radical oxidase [Myriangium duriaei CBS 260.36]
MIKNIREAMNVHFSISSEPSVQLDVSTAANMGVSISSPAPSPRTTQALTTTSSLTTSTLLSTVLAATLTSKTQPVTTSVITTQFLNGVKSHTSCVQLCDQYYVCVNAVFDKTNYMCHIKSNTLPWATDTCYLTIRRSIRLSKGSSSCTGYRGKWAPVINITVIPAGALVIPEQPVSNGVLGFSSWCTFQSSGATEMTQFADYNFQTGVLSQRTVTETQHDMFCPGMSFTYDGRMVVTGAENDATVSGYYSRTNNWTTLADMRIGRGYQPSTVLSDGRVFTIGGSFTDNIGGKDSGYKVGEIYDPLANEWTLLNGCAVRPMLTTYDADGPWRTGSHAWSFAWKNGCLFHAGSSKSMHWYSTPMHWYSTAADGSVVDAGIRDAANDTMKIFSAVGSQSYTNSPAVSTIHRSTIDQPGQTGTVESFAPMNYERGFANAVVLPNGQVVVTLGSVTSVVLTDVQSILVPELCDPVTGKFTVLSPAVTPRNHHSIALLLADGTVLAGGGGMCSTGQGDLDAFCDKTVDHLNYEVLSPPCLLNKDGTLDARPSRTLLSSNIGTREFKGKDDGVLTLTMDTAGAATFSIVRIGSATHSVNTDQRHTTLTQVVQSSRQFRITLPSCSGITVPGYYYLFAMNAAGARCIERT